MINKEERRILWEARLMDKHLIWAITIFSIIAMLCGTLIWINNNSWTLRFEMDDNTRASIESIEFEELNSKQYSTNLWIAPSENWTMVTQIGKKTFINGEEIRYIEEPILEAYTFWNEDMNYSEWCDLDGCIDPPIFTIYGDGE